MTNQERAANIKPCQIVVCDGETYKVNSGVTYSDRFGFVIGGFRKIKSKDKFSGTANRYGIGDNFEVVEVA